MVDKKFREPRLLLKSFKHCGFLDSGYATIRKRFRRGNSMTVTAEATVPEKLTGFQDSDGSLAWKRP
jgi:hypothetical protein